MAVGTPNVGVTPGACVGAASVGCITGGGAVVATGVAPAETSTVHSDDVRSWSRLNVTTSLYSSTMLAGWFGTGGTVKASNSTDSPCCAVASTADVRAVGEMGCTTALATS